ncbi:hypothetical protein [Methylomicrobium lacus]|uniref:hypothetical protein n=1 Tax=Methylomicrobium lacus TaxID=136992 RepID=UPI00045EBE17|nr:hypothetical protein [Methylomicrobium lacus]
MISEIDLLRDDIPRLERKFGPGDPFVQVLKAHLAALQNKQQQLPSRKKSHLGFVNFKKSQIQKSSETPNNRM